MLRSRGASVQGSAGRLRARRAAHQDRRRPGRRAGNAVLPRARRIGCRMSVGGAVGRVHPELRGLDARRLERQHVLRGRRRDSVREPAARDSRRRGGSRLISLAAVGKRLASDPAATFRYPGRDPHVLGATINRNLGGILRDAFLGFPQSDFRARAESEPRAIVTDVEPGYVAARIIEAITIGDEYLDNAWVRGVQRAASVIACSDESPSQGRPPASAEAPFRG